MRKLSPFILVLLAFQPFAQSKVSDHDVVKALMGTNLYNINPTLEKLGVWFYYHFKDNKSVKGEEVKPKTYSIANSEGHAKVFIIRYSKELVIDEIIINFRHDDRGQVEDMKSIPPPDEFHVGTYSSDYVYKLKK